MKYPVFLTFFFFAAFVQADSCQTVTKKREMRACLEQARNCGAIEDTIKRLECYDEIYKIVEQAASSQPMDNQPITVTPPSGNNQPLESQPTTTAPTPVNSQPLESQPMETSAPAIENEKSKADQLDDEKFPVSRDFAKKGKPAQMVAKIVHLHKGYRGNMTITLDNEQVWLENEASFIRFQIGDKVVIKQGLLGSNILTVDGQNKKSKVKRIR